jgi:hypothetical protein
MADDKQRARRPSGRPPAGIQAGEKVKDYPQLSVRLPPESKATLHALSLVSGRPQWRVMSDAINVYLGERPPSERRQVAELVRRATARRGTRKSR